MSANSSPATYLFQNCQSHGHTNKYTYKYVNVAIYL